MTARPTAEEAEHYRTPAWAVHRLLERSDMARMLMNWPNWDWIDPCCGTGALQAAVSELSDWPRIWTQVDIRPGTVVDGVGNYLEMDPSEEPFDVCIMNPPFSLALEFAQQAMRHCGVVIMLQRLNWLASGKRQAWLEEHTPAVYVLPNRPDFTGIGGDSQDYAWFVWGLDHCDLQVLDTTPRAIRKAQKPRKL